MACEILIEKEPLMALSTRAFTTMQSLRDLIPIREEAVNFSWRTLPACETQIGQAGSVPHFHGVKGVYPAGV